MAQQIQIHFFFCRHQFQSRSKKGYEVLFFGFWALLYLVDRKYSFSLTVWKTKKERTERERQAKLERKSK